jgi:hypothetical protein
MHDLKVQCVLFREIVNEIPSTTYATHGLYMYPAKFIPQVVRYVVNFKSPQIHINL